tara:strand:+ start:2482 stop:2721 length:240 start_codon:yes stop_codon:yes gene_type:complete
LREAIASSFLILASNAEEIPQVIAYNEPKILFEKGNKIELIIELKELLLWIILKDKIGEEARIRSIEKFDIKKNSSCIK